MGDTLQILIAMIIYMAAVIILGVTFARKANASSDAYFLGGRSLGPWVTAMSAEEIAAWLSAEGFEGVEIFGDQTFDSPAAEDMRIHFLARRP